MVDRLSKEVRSHLMAKIKGRDTGPERVVRSMLHKKGLRFRVCRRDLPGRPDLVFPSRSKVIFVHGCFWHGHGCQRGKMSKSRLAYWGPKIARTKLRDVQNQADLERLGWKSLVLRECEIGDPKWLLKALNFLKHHNI